MLVEKILCPTDLSTTSHGGIAYGITLARESGAELIILYATSFPIYLFLPGGEIDALLGEPRIPGSSTERWIRDMENEVRNFARDRFESELSCLRWRPKIGLGKVPAGIVSAACQEEADLIVMAKRDRGPIRRLFSRSISEAVSREAPCPLLSVCPPKVLALWQGIRLPVAAILNRRLEA